MAQVKQKKILWILLLFVFVSTGSIVYGKTNTLILASSSTEAVKNIQTEQRYEILLSDLPFKGPFDAPVTLAVFDDYQ
ncbi:MAG: hypothetical protein KAH09_04480 [Desulfobacula sp.]|nr:hypothetical protein [Desulfobacula sp.]